MIQDKQLGIVIIAAGNSSRLGSAKQLIKFKGHSLLQRTIKLANIASNHWVCVLGYQADRVRLELQSEGSAIGDDTIRNTAIVNPHWQLGMGSSIATGCKYFQKQNYEVDAVMIMLCDQYLLQQDDITTLIKEWQQHPEKIIASEYFDRKKQKKIVAAPAIFPEQYFESLVKLKEKGAKEILDKNKHNRITVPLNNAATDLDTKKDLKFLLENEHD